MDKKKFGLFIKESRNKKGLTQQELAELLYVDVTAVSKWERGVSYPDITLIPDICKNLEINEHELIESSRDTEYRRIKKEADTFNKTKNVIFYLFTISYLIAVFTCFIVNIAVDKKLSWFWIVLTSCLCGFCFCPTVLRFVRKNKLLWFMASSLLSLLVLYVTCSIYTNNYWCFIASIGTIIGYFALFFPTLVFRSKKDIVGTIKKTFILIYSIVLLMLLIILLLVVNSYNPIDIDWAIKLTAYGFVILFVIGIVQIINMNKWFKLSICSFLSSGYLIGLSVILCKYFKEDISSYYRINFNNWSEFSNGNVALIIISSLLVVSIAFLALGILKKKR